MTNEITAPIDLAHCVLADVNYLTAALHTVMSVAEERHCKNQQQHDNLLLMQKNAQVALSLYMRRLVNNVNAIIPMQYRIRMLPAIEIDNKPADFSSM